ncbi:uncharacterized protein LOC131659494 [Vicia villosa]|uniref:uncharacterized protein LOC131659494 n=1 Tax=Vicia villosa TaxID=3911 RepID=UPI00273CDC8B|nr:uncharacterized protein LOC131659494 [Vicia villosa]
MAVSAEEVREAFVDNFGKKFVEVDERRPCLEGIQVNRIKGEDMVDIKKPFKESEIREFIWSCGEDKSPGPDGYTFLFIKKCWDIIKEDFVNFFETFLLRSICLVGCMYKAVAKLLAGRLKGVLDSIVSPCQSAFLPGRQSLDGFLVDNEVVDYARKEGKIVCFSRLNLRRPMIE